VGCVYGFLKNNKTRKPRLRVLFKIIFSIKRSEVLVLAAPVTVALLPAALAPLAPVTVVAGLKVQPRPRHVFYPKIRK